MQRHYALIESLGAEVVAIAQGTGPEAAEHCRRLGVSFPCFGDPEKESYASYDLPRGSWKEILIDPVRAGNAALRAGHRVSLGGSFMRHSDWFQLPGVAIVDRRGTLRYLYRSRHAGDLPPICALVDVLEGLEPQAR
jgi:AhpC/TSA antioxidant enzyme